jgi:8-oxo-dGTP diphosphatase
VTVPPGYDPSDYPPFAVTVDVAVLTMREGALHVLLIERGQDPWKGHWALPGGFVDIDEDLADAALRELHEETGIRVDQLEQLGAYGRPDRDPRMRIVSVAYWTFVDDLLSPRGGDDAADALVIPIDHALSRPERFASDHHLILGDVRHRFMEHTQTP